MAVILIDGLTKVSIVLRFQSNFFLTGSQTTGPGSIWDPQPTSIGIASFPKLGVSFGLFMAGVRVHSLVAFFYRFSQPLQFSGHAGIPTLARDMIDPTQFDRMIDTAYLITTTLYGVIGVAGTSNPLWRSCSFPHREFRLLHVR